jgi:Icc-related predicted phosphoesterase
LARLRTARRVALLHYAPIADTVAGEPPEIFPFLGSSHLEDPINRHEVDVVFHGHAHRGCPEGRTKTGITVLNVSLPLLRALHPEAPFCLYEIEVGAESSTV